MNKSLFAPTLFTKRLFQNRRNTVILVVAFTFIMGGAIGALFPFMISTYTAHAMNSFQATIKVNPTSGAYSIRNDQVPITVTGSHYTANETVQVYWNYTGPSTGTLVATATADIKGAFSVSFLRQLAAAGPHTIAAVGQTSGFIATGTFTEYPLFYLRPQAAGPGTVTTAYGDAYAAGETVNIYWKYNGVGTGQLLGTAVSNSTGSFTTTITIPAKSKPGFYFLAGVGQTSQYVSKYGFTLYKPTLALAPLTGSSGVSLTVSAFGFRGLEKADIYWNNSPTPVTTVATSSYGYLQPTTIPVPAGTPPGSYPVTIKGETSHISIGNIYTVVAPAFSLNLTSSPSGAAIQLQGQGFAPGETVNISWNTTQVATAVAGYSGIVQSQFLAPVASNGPYTVTALGVTSNTPVRQTFTIANGLAASPASEAPGNTITVNGTGYQVNESVNLYWDTTSSTPITTKTADANGNILAKFAIPTSMTPGNHTIIGVGSTSGHSFTAPESINTNWGNFGYDNNHYRENLNEYTLSNSNVANLQLKWSAGTVPNLEASPMYSNGIVYQPTMDGKLNAYSATTGTALWSFNCQCPFSNVSSPLVDPANSLVFFGTDGYGDEGIPLPFYALDARTGTLVWSIILDWRQVGFPTLASNTLYIGTSHDDQINSSMYAIDELSGHIQWRYLSETGFWGAVGVDMVNNVAISGLADPSDAIIAFNAQTGAVLWKTTLPHYGPDDDISSGITITNGEVFASSKNGYVYELNEQTGAINWSTLVGSQGIGNISTQAISSTGTLYIGSMDGNLYAVSISNGAILWKTPTKGKIFSSPAIANGVVYFSSFDKNIYAVDATTGAMLWKYTTSQKSYSSPIVVNGWLYCSSSDGKLYAFSL